jgi:hypothetical protein
VLLWPIAKVLELAGIWPRLMARGMQKMEARRPPYDPMPHDVLVCSYMKSGTNWMMHIALQIAYRGHADCHHIHDLVPWIDLPPENRFAVPLSDDSVWQSSPTGLRIVKTHLPLDKMMRLCDKRPTST